MTETAVATVEQKESVAICVADLTEDVQLVAENVEQMQVAQGQMATWFRSKMQTLGADLGEVEQELKIATENGWRVTLFKSQIKRLTARISFYEKCALASEAGYCVIPNLPCDLFAVRTDRTTPRREESQSAPGATQVRSEAPSAGDGRYVDDAAAISGRQWTEKDGKGGETTYRRWVPTDFNDEIDFPISVSRPAVMSAAARAMALKVFDEMAVVDDGVGGAGVNATVRDADRRQSSWAATTTRKGDPLVIGIIRSPDRNKYDDKRISFLIGWYVDTSVL